jgi:hypothetical protein
MYTEEIRRLSGWLKAEPMLGAGMANLPQNGEYLLKIVYHRR